MAFWEAKQQAGSASFTYMYTSNLEVPELMMVEEINQQTSKRLHQETHNSVWATKLSIGGDSLLSLQKRVAVYIETSSFPLITALDHLIFEASLP